MFVNGALNDLQLTHQWKGTCFVSEYTGHLEGKPDFTAFPLYGVTLCFPEILGFVF